MAPGYQDPEKTVFVSNVGEKITEELLWELFLQAGPLRNIHIPVDRVNGKNKTFAFVTFRHICSVKFACELFNTIKLFHKPIYCKPTEDKSKLNSSNTNNSNSPGFDTPVRPVNHQVSSSPNTPFHQGTGSPDDRRGFWGSDARENERSHNERSDRYGHHDRDKTSRDRDGDERGRSGGNERDHYRGSGSHNRHFNDDRQSNYNDDRNRRYDNNRRNYDNPYGSSPIGNGPGSPLFFQAMNQSMNYNQHQSRHHDYENSNQYGPMRSNDHIQRHRAGRRQRSQPY